MQESGSDDFVPSHAAELPSFGEPGLYPFPGQGMYDIPHADAWPEPRLPRGVRHHLLSLPAITQPACHECAHGLVSRARRCRPAGLTCCGLQADCSGRLLTTLHDDFTSCAPGELAESEHGLKAYGAHVPGADGMAAREDTQEAWGSRVSTCLESRLRIQCCAGRQRGVGQL